jgi:coenzyme F420 hydrogenase subunit delta
MARVKHSALFLRRGFIIMGDDGFGLAVTEGLKTGLLSDKVAAGTGFGGGLACLPAPEARPESAHGAIDSPGRSEALSVDVSLVPAKKNHDFSLHRPSPINLLPELQGQKGICIDILAAQVALIPDETPVGSSLGGAVPPAGEKILQPLSVCERTPG